MSVQQYTDTWTHPKTGTGALPLQCGTERTQTTTAEPLTVRDHVAMTVVEGVTQTEGMVTEGTAMTSVMMSGMDSPPAGVEQRRPPGTDQSVIAVDAMQRVMIGDQISQTSIKAIAIQMKGIKGGKKPAGRMTGVAASCPPGFI